MPFAMTLDAAFWPLIAVVGIALLELARRGLRRVWERSWQMNADPAPEFAIEAARERGAISRGWYRVVVLESSGRFSVTDLGNLKEAKDYANDAASESEDPSPPLAYVFDDKLQLVARGRHYAAL